MSAEQRRDVTRRLLELFPGSSPEDFWIKDVVPCDPPEEDGEGERPPPPAYTAPDTGVLYLGGVAEVTYTGPVDLMTTDGGHALAFHAPGVAAAAAALDILDRGRPRRRWVVWPCGTSPARYTGLPCGAGAEGGHR
jgi:hypothetical protein